ncbi:MAG: hypothetical protein LUE93_05655 [Bacteroides sp.]|nr:hypothetical protein [Bacteroides sp.]
MKTINLLLSLVILLFTACSKNEETTLPVHTGKGVIETQCNVSETEAFRIIDETDIGFVCMYVDMALDTQGKYYTKSILAKWEQELSEKEFIGYVKFHSAEAVTFSFVQMDNKEYQQEWIEVKEKLGLINREGSKPTILFKAPEERWEEWVARLNQDPDVKQAEAPFICEVKSRSL